MRITYFLHGRGQVWHFELDVFGKTKGSGGMASKHLSLLGEVHVDGREVRREKATVSICLSRLEHGSHF